ncbi:MAG: FtsB family cell division protein [bacterium]
MRQHNIWRWLAWLACVALAYVAYSYLGGSAGLIQYGRLQLRRLKVEKEISQLQARQDSLEQVIFRLQNDTTYIEKIARERYYMGRPGETIYTVVRQPQANEKSK